MTQRDYRFFDKARGVANISEYNKVHIGCIAVYQGSIIGIGCNTNKTHPRQKYYNRFRGITIDNAKCVPKLHAEISCLNSIRHLDTSSLRLNFTFIGHVLTGNMVWLAHALRVWLLLKI